MILKLQKPKYREYAKKAFKVCRPFVANTRGKLVHRPRYISRHHNGSQNPRHIAVTYYCGGSATGTRRFAFLHRPEKDTTVCAVCEANATALKLPSIKELGGDTKQVGLLGAAYSKDNVALNQARASLNEIYRVLELEVSEPWDAYTDKLVKNLLTHIQTANAFLKFR